MNDDTILILTKPISIHGEEQDRIALREPTGKDIRELGLPYSAEIADHARTKICFEEKAVAKYISRLGAVPLSSVDQLSPSDWQNAMMMVMGFFGQADSDAAPARDSSIA